MSGSNYLFNEINSPINLFMDLNPEDLNFQKDSISEEVKQDSTKFPKFTPQSTSAENTEHEHGEEGKNSIGNMQSLYNDPFKNAIKKRKNIRVEQEIEKIKDSQGTYIYTENPKEYMKARKRMQNRESAQRAKFLKNMYFANIQKELEEKSDQNLKLRTEIAKLKTENDLLKRQLKYFEDHFANQNLMRNEENENFLLNNDQENYNSDPIFYGASSNYNSPNKSFFTAFTIFISIIALSSYIVSPEETISHSGIGIKGNYLDYGILNFIIKIILNPYFLILISVISQIILISSNTELFRKGKRIIRHFCKHRKHT